MAIYIAEMLHNNKKKTEDNKEILIAFQELLGSRSALSDEFKTYSNFDSQPENGPPKVKIMNSLEVNLMLAFLWLGCLTSELPVLEKDILEAAQRNTFGYLNEYEATYKLLFNAKLWPVSAKPLPLQKTLK